MRGKRSILAITLFSLLAIVIASCAPTQDVEEGNVVTIGHHAALTGPVSATGVYLTAGIADYISYVEW